MGTVNVFLNLGTSYVGTVNVFLNLGTSYVGTVNAFFTRAAYRITGGAKLCNYGKRGQSWGVNQS